MTAATWACALLVIGCTSSSATSEPEPARSATALPEPPAEQPGKLNLLDEEFVAATADKVAPSLSDGVFLFVTIDADGTAAAAARGTDSSGRTPTLTDPFRVGSVTKVFTAVTVLTLVDEGLVDLDTPAAEYVSRVAVPQDVTVRHLLQHASGLFSYTDNPDFRAAYETHDGVWQPEDMLERFADRPALFEPGAQFHYSNTNYLILGMLIEEVAGQRYDRAVRDRIIDPLALSPATYMSGFEDGPEPFDRYEHEDQADYDYTSIATSAWAAGNLVSSAQDVHVFFTALFNNQLVSAGLVEQMIEGNEYGFGLQLADAQPYGVYGHDGVIPGYLTTVRFSPDQGVTAFLALTDSKSQPAFAITDMLNGFKELAAAFDDS